MLFFRPRGLPMALGALLLLLHSRVGAQQAAQNFVYSVFESYLQQLQVQAGFPALSALILLEGKEVWSAGLGFRNVEASLPATPDTPYAIADLTQTMTAALVLHCMERGEVALSDPISKWVPSAESPGTTVKQLLTHAAPGTATGFRYAPGRFALLAHPVETCMGQPFRKVLASDVLDRLAMIDAVPGHNVIPRTPEMLQLFDESRLTRYAETLQRMAVPYKLDRNRRPTRSQLSYTSIDGSTGVIASARDLANFDTRLPLYLRPETLALGWTNAVTNGVASPFAHGWFTQIYQGEKLVWHFGHLSDGFSSLILKAPGKRLTLILLANSDGLSAPFSLANGDVTSSHFARTFLRLFL
jgi:CubicO group peptidase (beta-lactamase class C family)